MRFVAKEETRSSFEELNSRMQRVLSSSAVLIIFLITTTTADVLVSGFVVVDRSNATFPGDSRSFNAAPAQDKFTGNQHSLAERIIFAKTESDVVDAVRFVLQQAQKTRTKPVISARSGRHSYLAIGATTPGATVIDVSNLTAVNPPTTTMAANNAMTPITTITIGAGLRLYPLYRTLKEQYNLTFPGGSCPSVGVSGFSLGGGIGLWSRQHGLAAQNIVAARVVTVNATGHVVVRRAIDNGTNEERDLLFALRGAGNNNFGIVTELTLRVVPAPQTASLIRIAESKDCVNLLRVYEKFLADEKKNNKAQSKSSSTTTTCDITVTLDLYHSQDCAMNVLSTTRSFQQLSEFVNMTFLPQLSSESTTIPETLVDAEWLDVISHMAGCTSRESCAERAVRAPLDMYPASYWGAFSIYSDRSIVAESPQLAESILQRMSQPLSYQENGCHLFSVTIVDSLGCAVAAKTHEVNTSVPSEVTENALYHVQVLAYFFEGQNDGPSGGIARCSEAADDWLFAVWMRWQQAILGFERSYVNYPNKFLPRANERYFGSNLNKLTSLAAKFDPLRVFAFPQGLQ